MVSTSVSQPNDDPLLRKLTLLSKAANNDAAPDILQKKLLASLTGLNGKERRASRRILRDERLISTTNSNNKVSSTNLTSSSTLSGFGSINIDDLIQAGLKSSSKHQQDVTKLPKQHKQLKQQAHLLKKTDESNAPLPTALEQKEKQAIQRQVGYENVCKESTQWMPLIKRNRAAENLQFPLDQPKLNIVNSLQDASATRLSSKTTPQTELEQQVMSALADSADKVLTSTQTLTRAERMTLRALSVQEAQARRRELRRHRALLLSHEEKSRRVRKIKSKLYHRRIKKDRVKAMLADFERMRQENPDAALEKLRQLEEARIQERMSLKHRNTSKWAKQQLVRSKFDRDARQTLREQLELNRQLTHKADDGGGDDDDDDEKSDDAADDSNAWHHVSSGEKESNTAADATKFEREALLQKQFDEEAELNPWMSSKTPKTAPPSTNVSNIDTNGRAATATGAEVDAENDDRYKSDEDDDDDDNDDDDDDEDANLDPHASLEKTFARLKQQTTERKAARSKKPLNDINSGDFDNVDAENDDDADQPNLLDDDGVGEIVATEPTVEQQLSLRRATKVKKPAPTSKLVQRTPVVSNVDNSALDDIDLSDDDENVAHATGSNAAADQINLITEAFAEDDVYEEFRTEKLRAEQANKERLESQLFGGDKSVHNLPGWGEWSGPGAPADTKRKKRVRRLRRLRMTDGIMRVLAEERQHISRLHNNDNSIAQNENVMFNVEAIRNDAPIRKRQVNELPYPFASVAQYEAVMADSVGRDWNPETVVAQLTRPKIEIQRGAIIEAMSRSSAAAGGGSRRQRDDDDEQDDGDVVVADQRKTAVADEKKTQQNKPDIIIKSDSASSRNNSNGITTTKKRVKFNLDEQKEITNKLPNKTEAVASKKFKGRRRVGGRR